MMVGDTVIDPFRPGDPLEIVWDGSVREETVWIERLDAHRRTGDRFDPVASRRDDLGLRYSSLNAQKGPA